MWEKLCKWLERLGLIGHRHAWHVMAAWARQDRDGHARNTYFMIYRCARCDSTDEKPTALGVEWALTHGNRRDGLTYIPLWGRA